MTIILFAAACKGPEHDPGWAGALGTSGADEALTSPEWDVPNETGDTGGEPESLLLPTGICIQLPESGKFGYRHQCEGQVEFSFAGMEVSGGEHIYFGPGVSNPGLWLAHDNYGLPLVAACCGAYDYADPTPEQEQPYAVNCLADGVQQVCALVPDLIRREAAKLSDTNEQAIANSYADQIEDNQPECWTGLSGTYDPESWNSITNTSWHIGEGIWGYTITLELLEVTDWTADGDVTWETCEGFFDNDPAVVPTAPFVVPGTIAMSQATLATGSTMEGTGPYSSGATVYPSAGSFTLVQEATTGAVLVTGLELQSGPFAVVAGTDTLVIDRSSLVLRNVLEPTIVAGDYVVSAGDATFTVTATFDGGSRIVPFTNADRIHFRATSTGWEIDPFELVYDEDGVGTWSLDFDGLTFILPT